MIVIIKKEKLYKIYQFIYLALFIVATVMIILDYFQIIVDRYASNIIFLLVSTNLFRTGILYIREENKNKKIGGVFLIILSITSFIAQIIDLFESY